MYVLCAVLRRKCRTDHLSLEPSNNDGCVHPRVIFLAETKHDLISIADLTSYMMRGPEAHPTLRERRDRNRIEWLAGVERTQRARQRDGAPAMAAERKVDAKTFLTRPTSDVKGFPSEG